MKPLYLPKIFHTPTELDGPDGVLVRDPNRNGHYLRSLGHTCSAGWPAAVDDIYSEQHRKDDYLNIP